MKLNFATKKWENTLCTENAFIFVYKNIYICMLLTKIIINGSLYSFFSLCYTLKRLTKTSSNFLTVPSVGLCAYLLHFFIFLGFLLPDRVKNSAPDGRRFNPRLITIEWTLYKGLKLVYNTDVEKRKKFLMGQFHSD